jgi:hypothetical protein
MTPKRGASAAVELKELKALLKKREREIADLKRDKDEADMAAARAADAEQQAALAAEDAGAAPKQGTAPGGKSSSTG